MAVAINRKELEFENKVTRDICRHNRCLSCTLDSLKDDIRCHTTCLDVLLKDIGRRSYAYTEYEFY